MVISCDAYEKELKLIKATELRLGLPGTDEQVSNLKNKKRVLMVEEGGETGNETAPPSKEQIVGWPPIRSYRKNNLQVKKSDKDQQISGIYVKVSMDGAPYLRKIDLNNYVGYSELVKGLESMFKFAMGTDYAPTYEDKDGDWMLVGDVPWEMFINSCKRLRIMKGSEARSGRLAPAAAAISHVR